MKLKYHSKKNFACDDHIDMVMDEYINDNETFPELIECETETCNYCKNKSKYEIK